NEKASGLRPKVVRLKRNGFSLRNTSVILRQNGIKKKGVILRQNAVKKYVDGPTVTGNPNCLCVGNLFTDWSSYFPGEVVECGLATILPGTAFCQVLCIKVIT